MEVVFYKSDLNFILISLLCTRHMIAHVLFMHELCTDGRSLCICLCL